MVCSKVPMVHGETYTSAQGAERSDDLDVVSVVRRKGCRACFADMPSRLRMRHGCAGEHTSAGPAINAATSVRTRKYQCPMDVVMIPCKQTLKSDIELGNCVNCIWQIFVVAIIDGVGSLPAAEREQNDPHPDPSRRILEHRQRARHCTRTEALRSLPQPPLSASTCLGTLSLRSPEGTWALRRIESALGGIWRPRAHRTHRHLHRHIGQIRWTVSPPRVGGPLEVRRRRRVDRRNKVDPQTTGVARRALAGVASAC